MILDFPGNGMFMNCFTTQYMNCREPLAIAALISAQDPNVPPKISLVKGKGNLERGDALAHVTGAVKPASYLRIRSDKKTWTQRNLFTIEEKKINGIPFGSLVRSLL